MDAATNGNGAHALGPKPVVKFGAHRRVPCSVRLSPDTYDWVKREATMRRCSFSAALDLMLNAQWNLRRQLSALPDADTEGQTPVFAVLLDQHGRKMSATIDTAVKGIVRVESKADVIIDLVMQFAKEAMGPQRFSQWERMVNLKGGKQ